MSMRMTGLISGMDTESMVKEMVAASATKVDKVRKDKQKTEWKKEIWQGLNTKIYDFYKKQLSAFKTNSAYKARKATANDTTKVSVDANANASYGSHAVSVKQIATSAYMTGANIKLGGGSYTSYNPVSATTDFSDMLGADGNNLGLQGQTIQISTDGATTLEFVLGGDGENGVKNLSELNSKLAADENYKGLKVELKEGKLSFVNSSAKTDDQGTLMGAKYLVDAAALGVQGVVDYDKDSANGNVTTVEFGAEVQTTFTSADISNSTKLADLGIHVGTTFSLKGKDFVVDDKTTIGDFTSALSKMGVSASFDEKQGRFYINASGTGSENDFTLTSSDQNALDVLGLGSGAVKLDAKDAIIDYNGVEYRNSTNMFELNGLSITAKAVTGEYNAETGEFKNDSPINIEVAADTDAAYNTVKDFVKAYNALIDEMNTLYNEKKSGYDPLTDEERSQLSDTQIEQWEKKAKQGLLRRDSTLQSLLSTMRNALNQGITVTNPDGSTSRMSLSSLGIVTGDYSENGKLHILGDPDDEAYSAQTNKLKEALAKNPDVVSQVLAGTKDNPGVGTQMYSSLTKAMKRVDGVSSSLTFYNDVTMDKEIDDYDDDIENWQKKLQKLEDKYYDQFAAMESAMAKLQQQQSYLASLMGTA